MNDRPRLRPALAFLAALTAGADAVACSFPAIPYFEIPQVVSATGKLKPQVSITSVYWQPRYRSGNTCDGAGEIAIELTHWGTRALGDFGYYLLPVSGIHQPHLLPSRPIKPLLIEGDTAFVSWNWGDAQPDSDGHYRWNLMLIPISASGATGAPQPICVSTDDSCPE